VRVRGLKRGQSQKQLWNGFVAPRAGAWVETEMIARHTLDNRRTPCGCVG